MTKSDDKRVPALRFKGFTDEWEQRKISEIYVKSTKKNDLSFAKNKVISVATMSWNKAPEKSSDSYMKTYNVMKKGDIAFEGHKNKKFMFGRFVENDLGDGIVSHIFDVYRPIYRDINITFWKYYINSEKVMHNVLRKSTTSATMMHNLVSKDFLNQTLLIPSNNESAKIGLIESKIDNLITLQQRKVNDYFQYKTQLINTIFANKNWQIIKLRDVLSVPKEELANVTTKSQIMTVKLNLGGIINGANRDTLNLSATKYYIRHAGQFIFGKQNFFNGSMAIIPKAMDGKVTSQDVPALNINNEKINSKFLLYYLSRRNFYKHTERFATGTGSKRLHVDTLLNFKIRIPDISYQNQIVSTLTLLDKKLQLETTKLNKLKQLKQFLLQNMFI